MDVANDPRLDVIAIPTRVKYSKLVNKMATVSGFGVARFEHEIDESGKAINKPILADTRQYLNVRIVSKEQCAPHESIICTLYDDTDEIRGICDVSKRYRNFSR